MARIGLGGFGRAAIAEGKMARPGTGARLLGMARATCCTLVLLALELIRARFRGRCGCLSLYFGHRGRWRAGCFGWISFRRCRGRLLGPVGGGVRGRSTAQRQ